MKIWLILSKYKWINDGIKTEMMYCSNCW